MQPGSLVECIKACPGTVLINGKYQKVSKDIMKGDILTILDLVPIYNELGPTNTMGLVFVEIEPYVHPQCMAPCCYPVDSFQEIQPPMDVSIDEIIKQTSKA